MEVHPPQDIALLLACAVLVMLMQAGFCCLESGLVRSKNSINVAMKNLVDFCVASLIFWILGYALIFGESWRGFLGTDGFLFGDGVGAWGLSFFLFQLMFCGTATTIISGAVAERMRFSGYLVVAVMVSGFIYPVFAHWAWGGGCDGETQGWLRQLGFIDYAGSTVVHGTGGWMALAAVLVVGPRLGRFTGKHATIYGHNLPMASLGALLLWFGWFGFNAGSGYAVTDQLPKVLVNTMMSGASGGFAATALSMLLKRQSRIEDVLNGIIAGLVGITAGCHLISVAGAVVVGFVAAGVCFGATWLLTRLKIDDAVGAVPAHACAGVWGTLAVALLGDPAKWGVGVGRLDQLVIQAIGVGVCFVWSFGIGFIFLYGINLVIPLRIDAQGEQVGLNVAEHGARSPISDLVQDMGAHRQDGNFSQEVAVEPHTEVGVIAQEYNRVLQKVAHEIEAHEKAAQTLLIKNEDLKLLQIVAQETNLATDVIEVLGVILEKICAHTDWPVGHVYLPDEQDPTLLRPGNIWYLREPTRFQIFKEVTEATSFPLGIGLPGRVMECGKPAWIVDVTKDSNFPRAKLAKDLGVKAGFAFPVLVGAEVVAVLEFFSSDAIEPNPPLLSVMANVGTQLGRAMERRRAEDELRYLADHDRLTGLANRQLFSQKLGQAIGYSRQDEGFSFAVLFLDLDRFKLVNDSLGHEVGDHLLISVANRISEVLEKTNRSDDSPITYTSARLGGDEFVILLEDIQPQDPDGIAKLLQQALSTPNIVAGREVSMAVSIGIVINSDNYEYPEELLRDADLAMYQAKASGRARHVEFNIEMHKGAVERLNLETDLRKALEKDQLCLRYQSIVNLESGELTGFEALLRWDHPERGIVGPDRFVPIAEETGLIVPITIWVLRTAAQQLLTWQKRYPQQDSLSVNVNLSKNHLIQPEVVEHIHRTVQEVGCDPRNIKLEVTETMIMGQTQIVIPVLHRLRKLGFKLAMDDFGTGHSSLSNLHNYPIDVLKIDRSFISAMDQNRSYPAIVHAIVTLAHNLGMSVVAEGIETTDQVAQLQALECDCGQGYIFSKPLEAAEAQKQIATCHIQSRSA